MCASDKIQVHLCMVVLYCCTLFSSTNALHTFRETPIREALLKPRNFNPHPHHIQSHYDDHIAHQGAISLNTIDTNYVDNSLYNIDVENSLGVRHPSNGISNILSHAPHQFPTTLSPHGLRNLQHPYAALKYKYNSDHDNYHVDDDESLHKEKKQYAFSYKVRDTYSGDDFSHTQQQKNGAVHGTYKVQLPDGRVQVVRYTADDNGYRADVSYLIDKNAVHKADEHDYIKYNAEEKPHHNVHVYNPAYGVNLGGIPSHPPPTPSSKIFVSTAVPPIHHHHQHHHHHPSLTQLSLEQRQSISAHPTYVVSAKSTQISDSPIRIVPNEHHIDDNSITNVPVYYDTH